MPDPFEPEPVAESLAADLSGWARGKGDNHVIAAVELLVWHETWLRRADFLRACVIHRAAGLVAIIRWHDAREFCDRGFRASTSERTILELAVALGGDEYHLSSMGTAHRQAIATAVARAVGVDR